MLDNAQTKERARAAVAPATRLIARLGITPNILTVIGFLLNVVVGIVLASGNLLLGGILLLVSSGFDMFDGAVAKLTNKVTRFGGFLDSTLDRYSEMAILGGILWVAASQGDVKSIMLVFVVAVGSLMTSYTRARAEGLDLDCRVGLVGRPERIIILAIGLITGYLVFALALLAILTNFTALQRIIHVYRTTDGH